MSVLRTLVILAVGATLSACSPGVQESRTTSDRPAIQAGVEVVSPSFNVRRINVSVPSSLTVSEANLYYPTADIVWRGDQRGDRYAQVEAIVREAAERATGDMDGSTPVVVDIQVQRFHSLTEKARFSVGGVHNIIFRIGVRNAATDAVIIPPYRVEVDLNAYGGDRAIEAELAGQTQKVRIIDYLTAVIASELSKPLPI